MFLVAACGGRLDSSDTRRHQAGDPGGVEVVEPLPADYEDPILEDPLLNAGVVSILQPSFFGTAPSQTTLETFDEGATLDGNGDLTVLLVFDKSSSMLRDWDGKTRWQVANEALRSALDSVLDSLTIGAIRFPLGSYCGVTEFSDVGQVPFQSGRAFVESWRNIEHRLPSEGTPLVQALRKADTAIAQANADGRLDERFRVIIATDGEPTCNDDMHTAAALVSAWYRLGVETVVFGLPGSEAARSNLDALATAGGTGEVTVTRTYTELEQGLSGAIQ
jgi:hypothetical protein